MKKILQSALMTLLLCGAMISKAHTGSITNGMYIVRFTNGTEQ